MSIFNVSIFPNVNYHHLTEVSCKDQLKLLKNVYLLVQKGIYIMKLVIAEKPSVVERIAIDLVNENCIVTDLNNAGNVLFGNVITTIQVAICTDDFYVIETKIESTKRVISLDIDLVRNWINNLQDTYINNQINEKHRLYLRQNSPLIKY